MLRIGREDVHVRYLAAIIGVLSTLVLVLPVH